jgi:hypothetical protein
MRSAIVDSIAATLVKLGGFVFNVTRTKHVARDISYSNYNLALTLPIN